MLTGKAIVKGGENVDLNAMSAINCGNRSRAALGRRIIALFYLHAELGSLDSKGLIHNLFQPPQTPAFLFLYPTTLF